MNCQEIINEIENQEISISDFAYGEMENPLPIIGYWEEVEQHGGEGRGEDWYSVKYFKDQNIYIKTSGFYSSYNGTDFEDDVYGEEVKPVSKTITVYE
jgi:hypothetical protein